MKECGQCKETKEIRAFYKSDRGTPVKICMECARERATLRYQKMKAAKNQGDGLHGRELINTTRGPASADRRAEVQAQV